MSQQKPLHYFFIVAAVISIFSGAFFLQPTTQSLVYGLLVLSGLIVGALIIENQERLIISGVGYLLGIFFGYQFLGNIPFLSGIFAMLFNFAFFVSVVVVVLGIEQFVKFLLSDSYKKTIKKKTINKKTNSRFDKVWSYVILVAVALTFVILFADFFAIGKLSNLFRALDVLITALFIVDVFILYSRSDSFDEFLRDGIFDILSAIPLVGVLRSLKLIRAVKILRSVKAMKLLKLNKSTKFFSKKSSFNTVKNKKPKRKS